MSRSRGFCIAVASGKGGTGKTTIACALASAAARAGDDAVYIDCDVEEPNGHLFLRPEIERHGAVNIPVPEVDLERCTYCRACSEACRFSAILVMANQVLTFPKLCHGCGGCTRACPERAIREVPRATGLIEQGHADAIGFIQGRLDVGEAMAPPVIRAARRDVPRDRLVIIDAPPGTSCPVIAATQEADAVLLVTEPTPFGLSDLRLAVALVRELGLPFGVVVNRADVGDRAVFDYCAAEQIPILLELPDDRHIAERYAMGEQLLDARPDLAPRLLGVITELEALARGERLSTPAAVTSAPVDLALTCAPDAPVPALPSDGLDPNQAHELRELVIISGKGGTGKTSVAASFFALAHNAALADCDVDAADLHLVLDPEPRARWPFSGGLEASIDPERCLGCGLCAQACRFDALREVEGPRGALVFEVEQLACEGCGVCADLCPTEAVTLERSASGAWAVSDTRHGPLVHARLGVAQENSGKLVSLVRREARAVAVAEGRELLLVDGSPGIGCPVIASITGASMVLLVSEPTLSALHDLRRVLELTQHFKVPAALCINKADLCPEQADALEREAKNLGLPLLGHIPYDPAVTRAQVARQAVVEGGGGPAAEAIKRVWARVLSHMTTT